MAPNRDIFHLPVFSRGIKPQIPPIFSLIADIPSGLEPHFPLKICHAKISSGKWSVFPRYKQQAQIKRRPQSLPNTKSVSKLTTHAPAQTSHLKLILLNLGKLLVSLCNLACKVCFELLKLGKKLRICTCKNLHCKDSCILCTIQRHGCNRNT